MRVRLTENTHVVVGGDAARPSLRLEREDRAVQRARELVAEEAQVVFDVCASHGQMFHNVRHARWLIEAVAEEIRG